MLKIEDLLASKKCEKAFEFEYIDEHGNETGFFVSVLGDQAPAVKKAMFAKINRERAANAILEKRGKEIPVKPIEELIAENNETLSSCIVGWRGIEEEYTPALAAKVCENNKLFADQVRAASENIANFTESK